MPPPANQIGGLIKMPKKNPETSEHTFKVPAPVDDRPRGSLLGLDKLAAARRKEKQDSSTEEPGSKRSKVHSYKTGGEDGQLADDIVTPRGRESDDKRERESRNYRDKEGLEDEKKTPTPHRSYHEKISRERNHRDGRSGAVYASSNKCKLWTCQSLVELVFIYWPVEWSINKNQKKSFLFYLQYVSKISCTFSKQKHNKTATKTKQ